MIQLPIQSVRVEKSLLGQGPDLVHVTTIRGVWTVARVDAEKYVKTLGAELLIASAQLTVPAEVTQTNQVHVVLDGRPDYPHDFQLNFGASVEDAREFLRSLGFTTATVLRMRKSKWKTGDQAGQDRVRHDGTPVLMMLPDEETL